MRRLRGFTLIEIAVVLGIVLIVLSLGLTAISSQLSSASYSITKKRQDAIKEALIAYLGANKKLPCPQVPTAGTPVDGMAPPQAGSPFAVCPQAFGTIPFATLGLAREMGEDGWGNLFSYQVFAEANPTCPGPARDWANSDCFGAGKTGGITVRDGTVAAWTNLSATVVAVVISHGPNGLGGWVAAQGTRNASPNICEEAQNVYRNTAGITWPGTCAAYASNIYYKGESQQNDDVVAYLTDGDALQPLIKQGTVLSKTSQVNVDLQTLNDQTLSAKRAGITMSGSPPAPAGCATVVGNTSAMLDPWGNPYVIADSGVGGFPICVCSGNSVPITSNTSTCPVLPVTAVCKNINVNVFNAYLLKAGFSGC